MPYINCDWKDEVIPIVDTSGNAVSTVGWSAEMHVRKKAGATPAIIKLTTAGGTLLVGQATASGTTNGIAPNVAAASMTMATGLYQWDILRTDGGRLEWIMGGDGEFLQPITVIGLA